MKKSFLIFLSIAVVLVGFATPLTPWGAYAYPFLVGAVFYAFFWVLPPSPVKKVGLPEGTQGELIILKNLEKNLEKPVIDLNKEEEIKKSKRQKEPEKFTSAKIYTLVREALKADRIDVLLQPIVSLPQRKPLYYECFSRIQFHKDASMSAEHYLEIAQTEGMMSAVDNVMLFRCIQMVRKALKRQPGISFFCNISETSLLDPTFIESLTDFIKTNKDLAPVLIFEMNESTLFSKRPSVQKALKKLKNSGCLFSLHQLDHIKLSPEVLKSSKIRFVKFDGPSLLKIKNLDAFQAYQKALREEKIILIATHIENENILHHVMEQKIRLGQGFLLSEPKLAST